MESLTTDIILLSNLDHGDLNMFRQPIDVELHILAPARRRLERYTAKNLRLVSHVSVQAAISAPRKEFTHAILHILDNAFKFSPEAGTVELSVLSNEAGATTVRISDEGPGIPADLREKVFERFFQGSQGDTREHEGLGVGLTIARAVLEKMGGYVKILEVPKGCSVELHFPAGAPGVPDDG
jgi:signal transduction histidine kinase